MSNPEITDLIQVLEAVYMLILTILLLLIVWGLYDLQTEIKKLRETIKKLLQNR